jgi:predicted DNA binding protein
MSTIAELELPATEFALADTFAAVPDLQVEVDQVVAYDRDRVLPFAWVGAESTPLSEVADRLDADPSVAEVRQLADVGGERLYEMNWVSAVRLILHVVHEQSGTVQSATGRDGRWSLKILFPERASLSATDEFCAEEGIPFDVTGVYELTDRRRSRFGLTPEQHESLLRAAEMGYYAVPRESTLSEVADRLGITHQALSERIRRGHRQLVRGALAVDGRHGR